LAFAELEKSNAALRQQEAMVREKIKALEDEKKSTKSLVEQYQQMSKALTLAAEKANDENDINEINAKKKAGQPKINKNPMLLISTTKSEQPENCTKNSKLC